VKNMTKDQLIAEIELLKLREMRYRALLDDSSDPIFSLNNKGQYLYANHQFAVGLDDNFVPDDIIGKTIWEIFSKEEADKRFAIVKWVFDNKKTKNIEVRVPKVSGDTYHLTTVKPILDANGEVDYVICISKEITERKKIEDKLKRLAEYDNLTQVPNRRLFSEHLRYAITQAKRHGNRLALLFIDLDKFKQINDNYGHNAGDLLLKAVATRIQQQIRESDSVGRIGGDEFVVLLSNIEKADNAMDVAEKICSAIDQPFDISGHSGLKISSSMGVAIYPDHGSSDEQLMKLADDAMYQVKEGGRNAVRLFRST
jgi:diguanylate cyclase (GGDEF)-like protein/PAS domain S-box-containing protein